MGKAAGEASATEPAGHTEPIGSTDSLDVDAGVATQVTPGASPAAPAIAPETEGTRDTVELDPAAKQVADQDTVAVPHVAEPRFAAAAAPVPPRVTRRSHMWDSPTLTEMRAAGPEYHEMTGASRRRRWPWVVSAVAVVLIAAVGAVAMTRFRSDQSGPAQAVRQYFADLASGDTASAMKLVAESDSYAGASNPLLSATALSSPASRPSQASVSGSTETTDEGVRATSVKVSYTIDGTPVQQTVLAVRGAAGSSTAYVLKSPFITVMFTAPKDRAVKVNGLVYPAGAAQALAFPGQYTASVDGNALIAPATARATYESTGGAVNAKIWLPPLEIAAGAKDAVQAAVNKALDACAMSTSAAPPGCPFRYADDSDASMHWKVSTYPQVTVKAGSNGAVTYADGGHAAIVHYDATIGGLFGLFPHTKSGDLSVDVAGPATVNSGAVTVAFTVK